MKKQILLVIILIAILTSCISRQTFTPVRFQTTLSPSPKKTSSVENVNPTEEFSRKNSFGDGYVAYILMGDVNSVDPEAIIKILVTQWLEHYKTGSTAERAIIKDFQLGEITLLERTKDDPSIAASVWFSIIPSQIPNDWASFPGDEIRSEDAWWRLAAPFGVYEDKSYFWLRLMFGRGT